MLMPWTMLTLMAWALPMLMPWTARTMWALPTPRAMQTLRA
jgi:hypothetical protein